MKPIAKGELMSCQVSCVPVWAHFHVRFNLPNDSTLKLSIFLTVGNRFSAGRLIAGNYPSVSPPASTATRRQRRCMNMSVCVGTSTVGRWKTQLVRNWQVKVALPLGLHLVVALLGSYSHSLVTRAR